MQHMPRLLFVFLLLPFTFAGIIFAQYNYCGSFANECQVVSIAQCPQYCTPAQNLSKCPVNYVVCVQTSNPNLTPSIVEQLCGIYRMVRDSVYAISLLLFILGGTLYAISHALPTSQKGTYTGYGMGLILGGITIAIIALIAPFIIGLLQTNGLGAALAKC